MIINTESYWLKNARVPQCLISLSNCTEITREELCLVDLKISGGKIERVLPATETSSDRFGWDLRGKIILPCLVDVHTHLDKGHIWERSPNTDGTFDKALNQAISDAERYWQPEDVYRRMEFGLKCSYAHGTKAIRTHIDAYGEQADISLDVFQNLKSQWQLLYRRLV